MDIIADFSTKAIPQTKIRRQDEDLELRLIQGDLNARRKKPLTDEEKYAKIEAQEAEMMKRYAERKQRLKDQVRFGGASAISQQKIVLGAWLWKLSQTDDQVKAALKTLVGKMDAGSKAKVQKLVDVVDGKK